MDPDVRMDLEYILETNLEEIIVKFAGYVDCLRAAVKEKGVLAEDLRSYLLSLPAFRKGYKGQKLTLLYDKETELKKCDSVTDIFNFLKTKCASFLNYELFKHILKYYKISEDTEEFNYPEHLKAYVEKHKISEFAKINPLLKPKDGSKELILKYDIETTCRLAEISNLKMIIAKMFGLLPSALEIADIEDGCVIVTLHIPASIANAIFTPNTVFTPQQEEELRAAAVLWIKCNGHTYHFGKGKLKEESRTETQGK